MKIGIITLNIVPYTIERYYNVQEDGMGKALAAQGHEVIIYYLTKSKEAEDVNTENENYKIKYIYSYTLGKHAFPRKCIISKSLDCLIACSDNHLYFPILFRWCSKNNIKCIPYVGVIESNNSNKMKKYIIDNLCHNLHYYKRLQVMAKTPKMYDELREKGVVNVSLVPVGLDVDLLNKNYAKVSKTELKLNWDFREEEKVLLFVGRLEEEKEPLLMLDIFRHIHQLNNNYRLLMIGSGVLQIKVDEKIEELGIQEYVRKVAKIPNEKMWEAYRVAECLINLNKHEIFGMSILEAMYYQCRVIAWDAPGPRFILEDNRNGFICNSEEEIIYDILKEQGTLLLENAYQTVIQHFTWNSSARLIMQIIAASGCKSYGE